MSEIFAPDVTEGEIGYLATRLGLTIEAAFISPNESDQNGELANVVDGLYSISRALHHVARAIERLNGVAPEE